MTQEEREQFELKQFILTHWQKRTTVHWAIVTAFFTAMGFVISQKLDHPNFDHIFPLAYIFLLLGIFLLFWWNEVIKVNVLLEQKSLEAKQLNILKTPRFIELTFDIIAVGYLCIGLAFCGVSELKQITQNESQQFAIGALILVALFVISILFIIVYKLHKRQRRKIESEIANLASEANSALRHYKVQVINRQDSTAQGYVITIETDRGIDKN